MSGNQGYVKKDFAAIGSQITNIANRIRRNAVKNTTGGATTGTSVKSTIGYLRWSTDNTTEDGETDLVSSRVDEMDTRLAADPAECASLNDRDGDGEGDGDGSATCSSEEASVHEEAKLPKSTSSTSLNIPEPATNADTITEWQAGWNVTNAIQVRIIIILTAIFILHTLQYLPSTLLPV